MDKRQILILITCLISLISQAQELIIKGMKVTNDLSASQYRRMDLAGEACALVKVQLTAKEVGFEGNVIQPVEYKGGEYWVYMTKGSHELRIKHLAASPAFVPCHVFFADYGVSGVEPLATYVLTLLLGEKMQKLIIDYTPKDAMVIVDSKPYHKDGHLELTLPVGSHDYMIVKEGYTTIDGVAKLYEGNPRTIIESLKPEKSSEIAQSPIKHKDNQTPISNKQEEPVSQSALQTESSVQFQSNKETITVNGVSFNMIRVEGGTFQMGATSEQGSDAEKDEKPAHQVTLSSFSIGETEVTQELWEAVMGNNPSYYKGAKHPVEMVSWNDCQEFVRKLNAKTGRQFRLPTEAEWEYAARGGNKSQGYKYSGSNTIDDVAWYTKTTNDKGTRDVKTKQANELGLYDMSGNVYEWCEDWYGDYNSSNQSDPKGPSSGARRVCRGGGWGSLAGFCRVSNRYSRTPGHSSSSLGLRLAL